VSSRNKKGIAPCECRLQANMEYRGAAKGFSRFALMQLGQSLHCAGEQRGAASSRARRAWRLAGMRVASRLRSH
jgi:hypothetical protein